MIIFTQTRILSIRLLIFTEGIFTQCLKTLTIIFPKISKLLSAQTDCSDFLPAISGNSLVWVLSFRPAVSLSLKCTGGEISISPESAYRDGISYVTVTLSDLKFTGYDQSLWGHTTGYYYYTMINNVCTFVLYPLPPVTRGFKH